jgi:protein-disulfide isomerase
MVGLVLVIGVVFTLFDKSGESQSALPASIEQLDSSKVGAPLSAEILEADDNGIVFNSTAKPQIDIWEDFQCPYCMMFENTVGGYLEELVRSNQAKVVYHMASFLGAESIRAANAVNCSVSEGRFIDYHKALYAVQGNENSGIFSNRNLVEIGKRLGITNESFANCVNDNQFGSVVKDVNGSMKKNGVDGTPTVFLNGKKVDLGASNFSVEEFKRQVDAARG